MLFRCVVDDQVHNQLHVTLLDLFDEIVNICQRSITRIDILIVSDVVAHISLRALVDWGHPNNIDAQIFQIIKLFRNTRHISPAIVIGILEGRRVDLGILSVH